MIELISIIIPVYNAEVFLKKTLDSILSQTYPNWECILVDDGSTDNSIQILTSYSEKDHRFKLYNRPSSLLKGGNSCRNYGFSLSKGEFVNWFDADDIMFNEFLHKKINAFKNKTSVVICSGFFTDTKLSYKKTMGIFESKNIYSDYFAWRLKFITNSVMFRREFLEGKKLFDPAILRGQEFEFFTRLFYNINQNKIRFLTDELFLYVSHPNSISNKNHKYNFSFKESEAYTMRQNLIMAISISNKEVAEMAFKQLVNLLKKAIDNKHSNNVKFIIGAIKVTLEKRNGLFIFILKGIIKVAYMINLSKIKWNSILLRYPINYF